MASPQELQYPSGPTQRYWQVSDSRLKSRLLNLESVPCCWNICVSHDAVTMQSRYSHKVNRGTRWISHMGGPGHASFYSGIVSSWNMHFPLLYYSYPTPDLQWTYTLKTRPWKTIIWKSVTPEQKWKDAEWLQQLRKLGNAEKTFNNTQIFSEARNDSSGQLCLEFEKKEVLLAAAVRLRSAVALEMWLERCGHSPNSKGQ